jgi:hypothetical protein
MLNENTVYFKNYVKFIHTESMWVKRDKNSVRRNDQRMGFSAKRPQMGHG